jgi:hypothetical protein
VSLAANNFWRRFSVMHGLSLALDDDASSDLEGFDADHVETRSARPRLNIEA